jgi:hypothetical protein
MTCFGYVPSTAVRQPILSVAIRNLIYRHLGDVVLVLDNERLTNELQQGLTGQDAVTVLKLSKSGGV